MYVVLELIRWENTEVATEDNTILPIIKVKNDSIGYLEVFEDLEVLKKEYSDSRYLTIEKGKEK